MNDRLGPWHDTCLVAPTSSLGDVVVAIVSLRRAGVVDLYGLLPEVAEAMADDA